MSRKIFYVCGGVVEGVLVSQTIEASSPEEASIIFQREKQILPQNVQGPFYQKKEKIRIVPTEEVTFTSQSIKAIFGDWYVTALLTKSPENCAYLLFDRRVDGKKLPKPKGTYIVKLDNLRNYNEESDSR